jgi:hypothetical protein
MTMATMTRVLHLSTCERQVGAVAFPSEGKSGASGPGKVPAIPEPSWNHHWGNFRGVRFRGKPGTRFERKRLMRMNHRVPSEDSR